MQYAGCWITASRAGTSTTMLYKLVYQKARHDSVEGDQFVKSVLTNGNVCYLSFVVLFFSILFVDR